MKSLFIKSRAMLAMLSGCVLCASLLSPPLAQAQAAAPRVEIKTSEGAILLELFADKSPLSTENFLNYVRKGHYNGTIFHRVIDNFMIQGGGLDRNMKDVPGGAPILNEAHNGLKNLRGTVAMARTGQIHSATAQFFINLTDNDFLDHVAVPPQGVTIERGGRRVTIAADQADRVYGYAVFAKVVGGMDVVDKIRTVQTNAIGPHQHVPVKPIVIESVSIVKG